MEGKLEKPKDVLTVKEAIELINKDTRTNPVVRNDLLIRNVEFLRSNFRGGGMNYTIFLIKRDKNGKVMLDKKGKPVCEAKFVSVNNRRDQNDLEYAITDHYKEVSGRDVDPETIGLAQQTTLVNDNEPSGKPRVNKEGKKLKKGDKLGSGSRTVTEEEA